MDSVLFTVQHRNIFASTHQRLALPTTSNAEQTGCVSMRRGLTLAARTWPSNGQSVAAAQGLLMLSYAVCSQVPVSRVKFVGVRRDAAAP